MKDYLMKAILVHLIILLVLKKKMKKMLLIMKILIFSQLESLLLQRQRQATR